MRWKLPIVLSLALSLAGLTLLPTAALGAARLPSGAEIAVNVSHQGFHLDPTVAVFPDGGFVVVWSNGPGYDRLTIHARFFTANGSPASGEFRLVDPGTGSQHADQVVADRDGTFLVAWSEERSPGGVSDVFVRRFRRDGKPAGARSRVNPRRPESRLRARLAIGAAGRFAVAWTAYVSNTADASGLLYSNAMARFFAADGTPAGDEILVAQASPVDTLGGRRSFTPEAVTLAPDGILAIVFEDTDFKSDSTHLSLYKANREISTDVISGFDCCIDGSGGAALARTADGSLIAAWAGSTVFARRFSSQGIPQGQELVLPKQDFSRLNDLAQPVTPKLTALPEGGFLAVWGAPLETFFHTGVFARVFAADGTPLTRDFLLSSDDVETVPFFNSVGVAANQKGPAVVVWQEKYALNLRARLFQVR